MRDKRRPPGPPPTKTASIAIRVLPDVRDELAQWAAEERRSMSSLIDLLLADALEARRSGKGRGRK